jgi:hypothetical protein
MEHALHLAAKHIVKEVTPTPSSMLLKNMADEDDNNEMTDFKVADTTGKSLALVMQVCVYPRLTSTV